MGEWSDCACLLLDTSLRPGPSCIVSHRVAWHCMPARVYWQLFVFGGALCSSRPRQCSARALARQCALSGDGMYCSASPNTCLMCSRCYVHWTLEQVSRIV